MARYHEAPIPLGGQMSVVPPIIPTLAPTLISAPILIFIPTPTHILLDCFVELFLLLSHTALGIHIISGCQKEDAIEIINEFLESLSFFLRFLCKQVHSSLVKLLEVVSGSLLAKFGLSINLAELSV